MAWLYKTGVSLPLEVKVSSEDDIKQMLHTNILEVIPLGNDFKKPIDRTAWLIDDRDIRELRINEQATKIVGELTTPTKESMTHNLWAVDSEGKEVALAAKTDTPTVFPPIRGDIIITEFSVDGL